MRAFIFYAGFLNTGGPTRRVRMWALQLQKSGWEVTTAGLGRTWRRVRSDIPGVKYERSLYIPSGARLYRWGLLSAETLSHGLMRHLYENQYDIVHLVGPSPTTYPILKAAREHPSRTIYTEAFDGKQPFPQGFDRCWPLLDAIHGPTQSVINLVLNRARGFSGRTFSFASSSDRPLELLNIKPANRESVGFVGHLTEHKEVMRVLRVWNVVTKYLPKAELHVFGEGPLERRLRHFVIDHSLDKSVHFYGYEPDINRILSQFSVLINLCEEGHCTAAIEALAVGRELLLLERGCFPDLYRACEAVHMLSANSTDDEIAAGVIRVLRREELLSDGIQRAARSYFEMHFTPEIIGSQLIKAYESLLSDSRKEMASAAQAS